MRVLLSGGIRTENILSSIRNKFSNSGDDFLVIRYLEDIEEIFSKGDYFDKAVICEQSISKDNTIQDEYELRARVNDFAQSMQRVHRKLNFVFLTQTPGMANIVHEEIFPIADISVVVMKAPKPQYDTNFFATLIIEDIRQLPSDWIYVPEFIVVETPPEDDNSDLEFSFEDDVVLTNKITNAAGLMDDPIDLDNIRPVTLSEDLPSNEDYLNSLSGFTVPNEPEPIMDNTPADEYIQGFDSDSTTDIIKQQPQDYIPTQTNFIRTEEPNNMYDNSNLNNLPGFDIEPDNQYSNNGSAFGDDAFGNDMYDNQNQVNTFSGDVYNPEQVNTFGDNAFGNDMYDNQNQANTFGGDTFGGDAFGGDAFGNDYGNNADSNTVNSDYDNAVNSAFIGDYTNDETNTNATLASAALAGTAMLQNEMNQLVAAEPLLYGSDATTEVANTPTKKRGLLGRFGKGNNVPATQAPAQQTRHDGKLNVAAIKESLRPFAERGNSIVVTGCGGCGTSVIAYNLANIINQLGYTVLLVDMDTEGRTQSYISKDNYESMEPDGANLMSAVNSSTGIHAHVSVVKSGFRLLTMGLGSDTAPVQDILQREKISRFSNLCKTANNFIIYDVPFNSATNYLSDLTYMSDNLVLTIDASNWGITKTLLNMCNISSDEMIDTMFSRSQLVFNKYRNLNKVLGRKVKTGVDIVKVMDQKVLELIGEDPGFHFEDLHIAGIINDDADFETSWFDTVQYSDTKKGQEIFLGLLERIVLKK